MYNAYFVYDEYDGICRLGRTTTFANAVAMAKEQIDETDGECFCTIYGRDENGERHRIIAPVYGDCSYHIKDDTVIKVSRVRSVY